MQERKGEPGAPAPRKVLAATDLSTRSERALRRAAMLARQLKARLLLLHVVDDDQPAEVVEAETRQATALLRDRAAEPASSGDGPPEVLVDAGDPFRTIVAVAESRDVDLVVMGAHRRRILRDVFVGTTVERVMRTGRRPVLMVNAEPVERYRRVLIAVDLSEASANALRVSRNLGLLDGADLSVVHAFLPFAKGMMFYAGIEGDKIEEYVAQTSIEAADRLATFLSMLNFDIKSYTPIIKEDAPFDAIRWAVERVRPDLLVIGTRGHTGIKRVLLGSVADQVLCEIECDVLAVPPAGSQPDPSPPLA